MTPFVSVTCQLVTALHRRSLVGVESSQPQQYTVSRIQQWIVIQVCESSANTRGSLLYNDTLWYQNLVNYKPVSFFWQRGLTGQKPVTYRVFSKNLHPHNCIFSTKAVYRSGREECLGESQFLNEPGLLPRLTTLLPSPSIDTSHTTPSPPPSIDAFDISSSPPLSIDTLYTTFLPPPSIVSAYVYHFQAQRPVRSTLVPNHTRSSEPTHKPTTHTAVGARWMTDTKDEIFTRVDCVTSDLWTVLAWFLSRLS